MKLVAQLRAVWARLRSQIVPPFACKPLVVPRPGGPPFLAPPMTAHKRPAAASPCRAAGHAFREEDGPDRWVAQVLERIDDLMDEQCIRIKPGSRDDLNEYSILQNVSLEYKQQLVEHMANDPTVERIMGSMCGMAVGDMLGHPFEFQDAQDLPKTTYFDLAAMKFHGESNAFHLARGQWTDDASMGLCMADSLIMRRRFDGGDMRLRFWCWWNRGYNNAFRKDGSRSSSVGLGGNIAKSLVALSRLRRDERIPPIYEARTEDAGNGSLMRLTPIPLFMHGASFTEVHNAARMSSYTTHPGIIAAEACSFLAHLIVRAVNWEGEPDPKQFLEEVTAEYLDVSGLRDRSGWGYDQMKWLVTSSPVHDTEMCWNWKRERMSIRDTLRARGRSYNGYPVSAGYFGSYSLDGMALALWSFYHSTNFNEAVTRSVNLLGDADSHGSITGQLAGAFYGYRAIHHQFLTWLNRWDDHEIGVRAILLYHLGKTRVPEDVPEEAPFPCPRRSEQQPLLSHTRSEMIVRPSHVDESEDGQDGAAPLASVPASQYSAMPPPLVRGSSAT